MNHRGIYGPFGGCYIPGIFFAVMGGITEAIVDPDCQTLIKCKAEEYRA
jgi:hypothetical protein